MDGWHESDERPLGLEDYISSQNKQSGWNDCDLGEPDFADVLSSTEWQSFSIGVLHNSR
jgi:hypothetical protein